MSGVGLRSIACTHAGTVRAANEDAFLDRPDLGLWVVADGMGGATAGDLASAAVIAALDGVAATLAPPDLLADIRARIDRVNANLLREAANRGPNVVIGSTVVGLVVRAGHFACFWAGDSRLYRLRAGELRQLTRDHSLVQEMIDAGLLLPQDAESHPHASVINRAVGADADLTLEWTHGPIESGDIFLLCSDGLTRAIPDADLEAGLTALPIDHAAPALLATALEREARDNVTLILAAMA